MRKLLFITAIMLLLAGCSANYASSPFYCRREVEKAFPNSEVSVVPYRDTVFYYLVREPNGAVWYVETMSENGPEITKKELIFKAK